MTENNNFVHPSINQNLYPLEIITLVANGLFEDKRVRATDLEGTVLKDFKPGAATRAKIAAQTMSKAEAKPILVWYGRLVALQAYSNGKSDSYLQEKI
jgi:hypothetical protein